MVFTAYIHKFFRLVPPPARNAGWAQGLSSKEEYGKGGAVTLQWGDPGGLAFAKTSFTPPPGSHGDIGLTCDKKGTFTAGAFFPQLYNSSSIMRQHRTQTEGQPTKYLTGTFQMRQGHENKGETEKLSQTRSDQGDPATECSVAP